MAKNIAPTFTLVEERNSNGVPSVSVTFPDGHNDILLLDKFYANEEDRMIQGHQGIPNVEQCVYFGHLANEPEAWVAMTGCPGSEDVELTILSTHNEISHTFKWAKEGDVQILSRTDNDDDGINEDSFIPRNKTDYIDSDVIPEFEQAFVKAQENCAGGGCSLPATQHLQIRAGYDNNYLNHFNGNHLSAKGYLILTWAHVQAYYCQPSLGSKIYVELLPGIKHYNENLPKGDNGGALLKMQPHTENDLGSADLMLYAGLNCDGTTSSCLWGGGRVSEIGIVCKGSAYNKYKQSINNWGSSYAMYGESVAHEIAHQLGIHHDHSTVNGGTGSSGSSINDCNGKGLMSYGHHLRVWSSCSKANFEAYYSQEKKNWCMQDCEPNAHVNAILEYGASETVPNWNINCGFRGKPGTAPYFAPSCENWWCYNDNYSDGNNGLGVISTQLIGNGRGRLDYGICWGPSSLRKVTVYLNGNEISSVVGGRVLTISKIVEFDYTDSDTLMIEESGAGVLQFNSFSVIGCPSSGSANVCSNVPAPTDTGCGTYDGTSSCCTQQNPCNKGEGDCDEDHDCKEHLVCGESNCFFNNGFPSHYDCCEEPAPTKTGCHFYNNDNNCCTKEKPCNKGEGDCDKDHDCIGDLVCGKDNCHDELGFPWWGDCCKEP